MVVKTSSVHPYKKVCLSDSRARCSVRPKELTGFYAEMCVCVKNKQTKCPNTTPPQLLLSTLKLEALQRCGQKGGS